MNKNQSVITTNIWLKKSFGFVKAGLALEEKPGFQVTFLLVWEQTKTHEVNAELPSDGAGGPQFWRCELPGTTLATSLL